MAGTVEDKGYVILNRDGHFWSATGYGSARRAGWVEQLRHATIYHWSTKAQDVVAQHPDDGCVIKPVVITMYV